MLLEEQIVNQQPIGPHIHLRPVGLLAEQFGRHEDGSAHYLLVHLFLHREAKIAQLVERVVAFLLDEHIVRLDVAVHHLLLSYELQPPRQLVRYLQGLPLAQRPPLAHYVLQIAVGAKLEYHGDVVLCEEAVEDAGGEEVVQIWRFSQLLEDGDLAVWIGGGVLMMVLILLPYCLMSLRGRRRMATTRWFFTMTPL